MCTAREYVSQNAICLLSEIIEMVLHSYALTNFFFLFITHPAVEAAVELITGKQFEMSSEGNGPLENHAVANKALKRPNADSDEEEDKGSVAPPIHDIYRARQQKRIR